MEKIKILFVIDHLGKGGAERQFLNLVNNIDRQKFQPHVFIAETRGDRFHELAPEIKCYGLLGSSGRQTLKTLSMLKEAIEGIKPHIIQTWLDYSTFLTACVLKTVRNKPLFLASHRTSSEELYDNEVRFGKLKRSLLVWSYKQTVTVTTNSKFLEQQLKDYGVGATRVIYNGVDLDGISSLAPSEQLCDEIGLRRGLFHIAFVGSLVERKGIIGLIEAVKSIKNDDVRLLVIGDGELKDSVRTLIKDDKRFDLLGFRSDALRYIKASDLLVLPSTYEGLPNVILEAMAVRTPVVATNVYGIPELIEDGVNGLLTPAGDVGALKNAIEKIISNPKVARKFADVSLEKVNRFNIEAMIKKYEDLYCSLLSRHSPYDERTSSA